MEVCMYCGIPKRDKWACCGENHWVDETLCWNCSEPYPMTDDQCPACHATNPNVDFEQAEKEMSHDLHN